MSIGENIRNARKNKNLTMKQLGEKLNITEQAISQYERNIRTPNTKLIFKICEILEVDPSSIDKDLKNNFTKNLTYLNSKKDFDNNIIKEYLNSIKNPKRFILKNSFSVDVDLLTDTQIDIIFQAIEFTIKLKLEEFKNNGDK